MLQRIALYACLGYLLDTLEVGYQHWGFWCVLGLFWAVEQMTRRELLEQLQEEVNALRKAKGLDNTDTKD
jgi:hypothetical protein